MKSPQSGERKVIHHCYAVSFPQITTQYNQAIVLGGTQIAACSGGCWILLEEDYSIVTRSIYVTSVLLRIKQRNYRNFIRSLNLTGFLSNNVTFESWSS